MAATLFPKHCSLLTSQTPLSICDFLILLLWQRVYSLHRKFRTGNLKTSYNHEHRNCLARNPAIAMSEEEDRTAIQQAPNDRSPNETTASWVSQAASSRAKPQAPSLLKRFLPPVLGGLTAFPIAIGILWYGFGKDIGNAGPTIARYIPWLVPEHLRGSARWRYNPKTDSSQKQFEAPANLDAGEFGRIGGEK